MGIKLGKLLKIDAITSLMVCRSFTRLCVQIDVNKPLPKRIKIGTFWQDIVYENVPILCN